jgi:hypothetical protein
VSAHHAQERLVEVGTGKGLQATRPGLAEGPDLKGGGERLLPVLVEEPLEGLDLRPLGLGMPTASSWIIGSVAISMASSAICKPCWWWGSISAENTTSVALKSASSSAAVPSSEPSAQATT